MKVKKLLALLLALIMAILLVSGTAQAIGNSLNTLTTTDDLPTPKPCIVLTSYPVSTENGVVMTVRAGTVIDVNDVTQLSKLGDAVEQLPDNYQVYTVTEDCEIYSVDANTIAGHAHKGDKFYKLNSKGIIAVYGVYKYGAVVCNNGTVTRGQVYPRNLEQEVNHDVKG